jgi:hypothetical protein
LAGKRGLVSVEINQEKGNDKKRQQDIGKTDKLVLHGFFAHVEGYIDRNIS